MTTDLLVGDVRYRLHVTSRPPEWIASAERVDSGQRYGVEVTAATSEEAVNLLTRWLMWQHEHTAALNALQQAERAYHQAVAGSAFLGPMEDPSPTEVQKESLDALIEARQHLDEVRARKPF